MVLSPSSPVSSSVVALVACRPDARLPSRFLWSPQETAPPAIVVSPSSCRQSPPGYSACLDDRGHHKNREGTRASGRHATRATTDDETSDDETSDEGPKTIAGGAVS